MTCGDWEGAVWSTLAVPGWKGELRSYQEWVNQHGHDAFADGIFVVIMFVRITKRYPIIGVQQLSVVCPPWPLGPMALHGRYFLEISQGAPRRRRMQRTKKRLCEFQKPSTDRVFLSYSL